MKRMIVVLVGLALVVGGCSTTTTTKKVATSAPPATTGGQPVVITLTTEREAGDVIISGTASVSDGALVCYEVTHDYGDQPLPAEPYFTNGNIEVQNGKYSARVVSVPPGTTDVWAAFQTIVSGGAAQPAWVADAYGEMGEKMTGDITKSGEMTRVEKQVVVE